MITIIVLFGLGSFYFRFLTHAFLNGLLFTCAAGVIRSLDNYQDIRSISGLSVDVGSP